jgi:hypothetical protein
MKKLIFFGICIIFTFVQSDRTSKRKYETCKANCSVGCGCGLEGFNCEHKCYKTYCRSNCFELHNKACKACFKSSTNKADCFNSPACKKRKECLDVCDFIYDTSTEKNENNKEGQSCSECFCFNNLTKEFLGKIKNNTNKCLECNSSCKNAYKKFENLGGVKGVCR